MPCAPSSVYGVTDAEADIRSIPHPPADAPTARRFDFRAWDNPRLLPDAPDWQQRNAARLPGPPKPYKSPNPCKWGQDPDALRKRQAGANNRRAAENAKFFIDHILEHLCTYLTEADMADLIRSIHPLEAGRAAGLLSALRDFSYAEFVDRSGHTHRYCLALLTPEARNVVEAVLSKTGFKTRLSIPVEKLPAGYSATSTGVYDFTPVAAPTREIQTDLFNNLKD